MEDKYDAIICGTGIVECVLAGMLAVQGKKILVLDRNGPERYGGDCASVKLDDLYKEHNLGKPPEHLGRNSDYNIDLAPTLALGNGLLSQILFKTVVKRYDMTFTVVEGSYVLQKGKIRKVPITPKEALSSSLMGFFEKRRAASFFDYVANYDAADPKTHGKKDLTTMTFRELVKSFGLEESTEALIGTAIALELDSAFLHKPAIETLPQVQLYLESQLDYTLSPYVYPIYGLGDIPQVFARLCAVFNGVFILEKPDMKVIYDDEGKFAGVESEGETARAPFCIGDPKYFPEKTVKTGDVVRAVCILSHPIAGTADKTFSAQIILPARETGRNTDMYVCQVSGLHRVCPKDKFIAIVSATMEGDDVTANIKPGLALLGKVEQMFVQTYPQYSPDPSKNVPGDNCHIGKSLDATSHFENETATITRLYEQITGKPFNIDEFNVPSEEELMKRQLEEIAKLKAAEADAAPAADAEAAPAADAEAAPAADEAKAEE